MRETTISRGDNTAPAVEETFRATVEAVLKGQAPGSFVAIHYVRPKDFDPNYRPVPTPAYRISFLVRLGDQWTFTDSGYPTLPGIRPAAGHDTQADPLDAVVTNLGGVLAKAENRNDKVYALFALRGIPKRRSVVAALLGDINDPESAMRLDIVGALLSLGAISHLNDAASALLKEDPALPVYALHNLRVGIAQGVNQPEALPVLADLLKSPNVETRRAAITAIVRLGTVETIQPLRSALGDPDQEVRFNSVLGLARVTGQTDWVPNMDVFMADEGKYLSHWK